MPVTIDESQFENFDVCCTQESSDLGRQVLQGTDLTHRRTMILMMMLISEDDER